MKDKFWFRGFWFLLVCNIALLFAFTVVSNQNTQLKSEVRTLQYIIKSIEK